MRTTLRTAAAALVGAALLFAASPLRAAEADLLPVGSPAPAFEAVDTDGKAFTLAEALKEKPVLLVFWSIFCGTCRDELPILEQEKPKYADKVQFVTVNLDEAPRAKTVKGFAKQQGFTFRMLLNKIDGQGVPDRPDLQDQGDAGALPRQEGRHDRLRALRGAQPRGAGRGHRQGRVTAAERGRSASTPRYSRRLIPLSFSWIQPASFSPWQRTQFCSIVSGLGNFTFSNVQACVGVFLSRSSPGSWHSPQATSGWEKSNMWSWIV